jgi:hypothetical protein
MQLTFDAQVVRCNKTNLRSSTLENYKRPHCTNAATHPTVTQLGRSAVLLRVSAPLQALKAHATHTISGMQYICAQGVKGKRYASPNICARNFTKATLALHKPRTHKEQSAQGVREKRHASPQYIFFQVVSAEKISQQCTQKGMSAARSRSTKSRGTKRTRRGRSPTPPPEQKQEGEEDSKLRVDYLVSFDYNCPNNETTGNGTLYLLFGHGFDHDHDSPPARYERIKESVAEHLDEHLDELKVEACPHRKITITNIVNLTKTL